MFPCPGYFHYKGGVVSLWYFLVKITYIWFIIYLATFHSQCLMVIRRDGALSTMCHSYGSASQQRELKMFPGHGYFLSEDGVVWQWYFLVNFHIYIYISIYISIYIYIYIYIIYYIYIMYIYILYIYRQIHQEISLSNYPIFREEIDGQAIYIYIWTQCVNPVSLANHLRGVADAFCPLWTH